MKEIDFKEVASLLNEKLNKKGVFLSAGSGDKANSMTISWGAMGVMWSKPIMIAPVRNTRHTYGLIKENGCFTVSIPVGDGLDKELAYFGSHSGRDVDKFAETGLTAVAAEEVDAVIVKECQVFLECRVLYETAIDGASLPKELDEKIYALKDYHTLFVGEIVRMYKC